MDPCCHLVSISPIFYEHLFHMKVFLRSFYVLTIWVCIFWQMDFGAKAAHKMLVKLPPGDRNWQLIYPNCFILLQKIAISLPKFECVP